MSVTAVILPCSGPYASTWAGASSLGMMDDNGFQVGMRLHGEEVNRTDAYAMTLIEAIYQGQDWNITLTAREWNKSGTSNVLLSSFLPFGQLTSLLPSPTINGVSGPSQAFTIGDRFSKYAQILVLTALLATPAPTSPLSLTANGAILSPSNQSRFTMTSKVRDLPLDFALLPYVGGTGNYSVIPFSCM